MGHILDLGFSAVLILLSVRTLAWHLQNWQLREYRFDRMRSRLKTKSGKRDIWNLWFFPGMLPRPALSLRVLIILFFVLLFVSVDFGFSLYLTRGCYADIGAGTAPVWCYWLRSFWEWPAWAIVLLFERFIWLYVLVAVWVSQFPVWFARMRLFRQVKHIIAHSDPNIIRVALTGSYGKSSTKEILVHLLQQHFGHENVLYNKANFNHEIALARLIKNNRDFFTSKQDRPRICVFEAGAYKRGDLAKVTDFFAPHYSILTAVGNQHIDIFGSQRNIQLAKFELAEGTSGTVFYNADSALLAPLFEEKQITARSVPISLSQVSNVKSFVDMTNFLFEGNNFTLPWPGEFFVMNALLAIQCAREIGVPLGKCAHKLSSLLPLQRALSVQKHKKQHYTILQDLYSANANGVLAAINHLSKIPGKKIFVGIPLLELGDESKSVHKQIFTVLKDIDAQVWWLKEDHKGMARSILDENFHHNDLSSLKDMAQTLTSNDGVLLESRVTEEFLGVFE